MGGSSYSRSDYDARTTMRAATARTKGISVNAATMAFDADIKAGRTEAKVHDTLSPHGAKVRESRDSVEHPVTVPIIITLDTTGSMSSVPFTIQKRLSELMGNFIDDKASGKKYLGEGYPAIMISAVDDYPAQGANGCLQVGQFESGIEIDDNLTNLWITHNGGGTYQESYELALYFAARHTVHDHLERRGRKGYMFIIGDEMAYEKVTRAQIKEVINDDPMQDDVPLEQIIAEAQEKYHVFFVIPNQTSHFKDPVLEKFWVKLLGQQNVLKLEDPEKICSLICGAVAICEEHIGIDDLTADGLNVGGTALALLASTAGSSVARHSAAGLEPVAGAAGGSERL